MVRCVVENDISTPLPKRRYNANKQHQQQRRNDNDEIRSPDE